MPPLRTTQQLCRSALSSGVDAVNASIPRRILTSSVVGPLPVTGNLRHLMKVHEIVGMQYRLGASPEEHGKADCLSMCRTVLSSYNISTPEPKRDWYRRLRRGDYSVFKEELEKMGTEDY